MIDMRYKPKFLPQLNAPYDIVLQKLDEEGIDYNVIEIDPNKCKPSQGVVIADEVYNANVDDNNPIWVDNELNILDGHHRFIKALLDNVPIKAVKLELNQKDACRVLNKIQDIYEYEQAHNLEEVESQDAINYYDNNSESGEKNSNT